jgi:PAS domain S-box-containing protein
MYEGSRRWRFARRFLSAASVVQNPELRAMTAPDSVDKRVHREIASRKEAERLLEAKSLELYLKNQQLQTSSNQLREQIELISVIMDAVPDIVITCNDQFRIATANSACAVLMGYSQAEFVGAQLSEFIPRISDYAPVLDGETFIISDIEAKTKDGSWIDVELRGRRTRARDKNLIVMVIHDVSGRKASERMKEEVYKQLHESRRLEAIGALSSGIAHELNTPIQFIGDNIKFIGKSLDKIYGSYKCYDKLKIACQERGLCPEIVTSIDDFNRGIDLPFLVKEIITAVQETIEGVRQVRDIIVLMKEFAHPGMGSLEPNDLNAVVKGALTICRSRTKNIVSVEADLAMDLPPVACRRTQIQQVIVNLIVNAVEAIEEQERHDGLIQVTTKAVGALCRVEISDNGPGIPEKLREKVFDPFFTTKQVGKGTGQGLALAKDIIIQQHHGRLYLEDKPGFSTCFVIELPISETKTDGLQEKKANAPA